MNILQIQLNRLPNKRERGIGIPGICIALYGPDGAGKSAVAARVAVELANLFSGVQLHHLRISLGCTERQVAIVTQPHAQQPRGLILSCLKLFYVFAQSWLAHLVRVLFWVASGQLVIFDRYFLDYPADPKRYRLAGESVRLASLLASFAPQPDLQFVLDVPAEELQRRKPEVSLIESRRQRQEYAALIGRLPNAVLVHADRPIAEVASVVANRVLQYARCASEPRRSLAAPAMPGDDCP